MPTASSVQGVIQKPQRVRTTVTGPAATLLRVAVSPVLVPAEIELCVRARQPLLYVVTWEEERAVVVLEQIATRLGKTLHVWTQTRGLSSARATRWDPALTDPLRVLDHVATAPADDRG